MGYREYSPPAALADLVECGWVTEGPSAAGRILPDGCMDLIRMEDQIVVAGPDTGAYVTGGSRAQVTGLRFRPGALPRLLGVPAAELRNSRVPLREVRSVGGHDVIEAAHALASVPGRPETTPWSLPLLDHVTARLAAGATVTELAGEIGWSSRTLQRQCSAVYGYGPATLRRILRFRRAVRMLRAGLPYQRVAADAGYADQPHLHREVRALAGVSVGQLVNGAYRSTEVPSESSTVA